MSEAIKSRGVQPIDQSLQFETYKSFVVENITNNAAGLDDMAAAVGVSKFALTRIVKKYGKDLGIKTPVSFLWSERVRLAHEFLVANPEASITDAVKKFGFGSPQHFSRTYRETYGVPASQNRKPRA